MEQCRHNFIYGNSDYFCKKCGCLPARTMQSADIVDAEHVTESTAKDTKNNHSRTKSKFLTSVVTGLSVSLSMGFVGIFLFMLYLK